MQRPRLLLYSLPIIAFFGHFPPAAAQSTANTQKSTETAAQEKVSLSVSPSGMLQHVPGHWATMSTSGRNLSDQDAEELVVVQVGENAKKQFARRVWIPSRSRRQSWLPVLIPENELSEQNRVDLISMRLRETNQGETFLNNAVGQPLTRRSLQLSPSGSQTGVLSRPSSHTLRMSPEVPNLLEVIHQLRDEFAIETSLPELTNYSASFLPPSSQTLDSLDQLIVIDDGFLQDTTAAARIDQWVHDGGRLWVMIDRISTQSLRTLLGESMCFTPLDRIELNQFDLDGLSPATGNKIGSSSWSSDRPATMVRGNCDADQVLCRINDWPAVFTKSVGKGEVLFTTIDAQTLANGQISMSSFRSAASNFFSPSADDENYVNLMTPVADLEIGYQIPGRTIIGSVLIAQLLLVLAAGIWLFRTRRLERLAIVIPVSVCIATAGLIWLGKHNTGAVPPRFASGQFARVVNGGSEIQMESISAVYSDQTTPLQLTASPRTNMSFQDELQSTTRLLWTDDGSSQWMNVTQPPGVVRHITSEATVRLPSKWAFHGQFTQRGFEGRFDGFDNTKCEEAIVASDSIPTLALAASDDAWLGTPGDVLSAGQFSGETILTDRLRTRQDVLRSIFANKNIRFGREPTLLFWTDALPSGLKIEAPFSVSGSALVHLPIHYRQTPPDTSIKIPSSFVRLEIAASEEGFSTLYNQRTGQWLQGRTKAQSARLNCHLPESVWPCKLSKAVIEIKLSAPSRTLQLEAFSGKEFETIYQEENPNGLIRIPLDDPKQLFVDSNGAFALRVSVSQTTAETAQANSEDRVQPKSELNDRVWQIDFLRVSFDGITT